MTTSESPLYSAPHEEGFPRHSREETPVPEGKIECGRKPSMEWSTQTSCTLHGSDKLKCPARKWKPVPQCLTNS